MSVQAITDTERELLSTWLTNFKDHPKEYIEPILNSRTVALIKQCCDMLKQDSHVFIMSVDTLTKYITTMNKKHEKIEDELLTILSIICIGSKYIGVLSELKFVPIVSLYESMTDKQIAKGKVKQMEMNILYTLQGGFPVCYIIDDLKALVQFYIIKLCLKVDLNRLCIDILNVVYIYYRRMFTRLRELYKETMKTEREFKKLIMNRLYIPSGILLTAFKLTNLQNSINLYDLTNELSVISEIDENHIELLTIYILDIVEKD